jgi:HlyD family secretion protein
MMRASATLFVLAVGLVVVGGAGLAGCSKPTPVKSAEAPLTLTVATVALRPLSGGVTAQGALVSREEAGVASELAGYRIAEVYVDEGAYVKKGQPLAKLDDTLLRAQIAQAEANYQQQLVAGQRAQAEADRVKGLDNAGVLSMEQISERRLSAKGAQAQVAVAKAQLDDLKVRDASLIIRAPVSGRVLERNARPGDTSALATTLFRIARDGLVEFDAEVSQADLGGVTVGEPVQVDLPSGAKVMGHVRFISPRVDAQTGLGHVRVALPVRDDLRPGGFARGAFQSASRPLPTVPESAIHFDANGPSVMVIDDQDRVRRAPIRTGQRAQGYVQLLQGPPVGARVALGGGAFVLDGDKVRVASQSGGTSAGGAL